MAFPADRPPPHQPHVELLTGNGVAARARPWSPDPNTVTLTLLHPSPVGLAVHAQQWLAQLADAGYRRVRTSALSPEAAAVFERFGLHVIQRLVVLSLGPVALSQQPDSHTASSWRIRALRWRTDALRIRDEVRQALVIDREAFGDRWCLDEHDWRATVRATPRRRVAVVEHDGDLVGFGVTGSNGDAGFLQRLAVAPAFQRRGVARAIVIDAVAWAARNRLRHLYVNTAHDNHPALALYESTGFRHRADGLVVLEGALERVSTAGA